MTRRNKSSRYSDGTIIQTRDEHLHRRGTSKDVPYTDSSHPNPRDFYRTTIVVDSNRDDELALVKRTTNGKKSEKGTVSNYIEILDSNNNPIKIGAHFKARKKRIPKEKISEIRKDVFKTSPQSKKNRYLVHKYLKKRK